jgi:hypothetical protein
MTPLFVITNPAHRRENCKVLKVNGLLYMMNRSLDVRGEAICYNNNVFGTETCLCVHTHTEQEKDRIDRFRDRILSPSLTI